MYTVICNDANSSNTLKQGERYYAFPHGEKHFNVSIFKNAKACFGTFERKRFKITSSELTESRTTAFKYEYDKMYVAKLKVPTRHFEALEGDTVFIVFDAASQDSATVYSDAAKTKCYGRMALVAFDNIEEAAKPDPEAAAPKEKKAPKKQAKPEREKPTVFIKILPPDPPCNYEQLSLFD